MLHLFDEIRNTLSDRRAAAEARNKLARELNSYSTPAERAELDSFLSRAEGDISEIEDILSSQRSLQTAASL